MPQSISDGALQWQRLATLNKHPRDERIQFQEEGHLYTIDGTREGWTSCTTFVHGFFGTFDADAIIAKMRGSYRWAQSKYFGMTDEAIKKQWEENRDGSSTAGTRMHLDIEHFYNAMPPENYTLDAGLAGLAVDAWAPNPGSEWDYFCAFQRDYVEKLGFVPFRTEWLIFDEEYKVCGSVDMIYKKPDGTLAIYDWKRTKELKTENRYDNGLGPLTHLPDVNYWHYTLQLNVYRYILEKHYGYVVSELALVILHPVNSTWQVKKLNFMDAEVAEMMGTRP